MLPSPRVAAGRLPQHVIATRALLLISQIVRVLCSTDSPSLHPCFCQLLRFGQGDALSWWAHKLHEHAVCVRASALELLQQGCGLPPPS